MQSDAASKLTSDLTAHIIERQPSEEFEVVIEVTGPHLIGAADSLGDRKKKIEHCKETFNNTAEQIEQAISSTGGRVTGKAWINHTIRAVLPINALNALATSENIRSIDIPHQIELEKRLP